MTGLQRSALASVERIWVPGRRLLTVGLVATVTLFASEALALATIMPKVADDLGRGGYGPSFSAFFLGQVMGTLVGGRAADRFGPSRPFVLAAALFAAGLVVGGSAHHIATLIAGRALQGIGAGAITPIEFAVIGRAYPEAIRARMFAITSTAWVLPGLFGPALAGIVAEAFGWRWVFLGLLPLVVIALCVTWPGIRPLAAPTGAATDLAAWPALVLAASAGLMLGALTASPWWIPLPMLLVGAALFGRASRRFVPAGVLRLRRGLPATVAARLVLTLAFVTADAFLPFAVTEIRHRSVLMASLVVTAPTLSWTAGAWVAERVINAKGAPWLVRRGFGVLAVGLVGELALLAARIPFAVGIAGSVIAGLGIGLAFSPLSVHVLAGADAGSEGRDSAALSLFDGLGFAIGPAIAGAFVNRSGWTPAVALTVSWSIAAAVALGGVGLASRLVAGGSQTRNR